METAEAGSQLWSSLEENNGNLWEDKTTGEMGEMGGDRQSLRMMFTTQAD